MTKLQLQERTWAGWLETPPNTPGWAASPVFITSVKPLKTGNNWLKIQFIQPLHPRAALRREITAQVVVHQEDVIVLRLEGGSTLALLCRISFAWIESYAADLWRRRPPLPPHFYVDGKPLDALSPTTYLTQTFGAQRRTSFPEQA